MTRWVKEQATLSNLVMVAVLLFQVANFFGGQTYEIHALQKEVARLGHDLTVVDAASARREVVGVQLEAIEQRLKELKAALERHDELTRPR